MKSLIPIALLAATAIGVRTGMVENRSAAATMQANRVELVNRETKPVELDGLCDCTVVISSGCHHSCDEF